MAFELGEIGVKDLMKKYKGGKGKQNSMGIYEFALEKKKDDNGIGIEEIETTFGGTKK